MNSRSPRVFRKSDRLGGRSLWVNAGFLFGKRAPLAFAEALALVALVCGCSPSTEFSSAPASPPAQQLVVIRPGADPAPTNIPVVRLLASGQGESVSLIASQALVRPNLDLEASNASAAKMGSSNFVVPAGEGLKRPRPPGLQELVPATGAKPAATNAATWRRFISAPGGLKVRLDGFTSFGEWHLEGDSISGTFEVGPGFPTQPGQTALPGLVNARATASIPVNSLLGVASDGHFTQRDIDERLRETLRAADHPEITFWISALELKGLPKSGDQPYTFEATGDLALGGVTNQVRVPVFITPIAADQLRVIGETKLKMSDFNLVPSPGVLVNPPQIADEIKLSFEWMVEDQPAIF